MNSDLDIRPWGRSDHTDRKGAEMLKAKIEAFWRERGYEIQVTLAPAGFTQALRAARFDLRSELVNGLPRRCCAQSGACAKAA